MLPVDKLKGTDPVDVLDFSRKGLGMASAFVIATLIGMNPTLQSLNLSSNRLAGEASIWQELFGEDIDKSDTGLEAAFAKVDLDRSGKMDAAEVKAYILAVYENGLNDTVSSEMMATADTNNDGEVDLDEFKIIMRAGPKKSEERPQMFGVKAICDALRTNSTLTSLNLSSNRLCGLDVFGNGSYTAEVILVLAEALCANKFSNLLNLDLSWNDIGLIGANALASALVANRSITEVRSAPPPGLPSLALTVHAALFTGECGGLSSPCEEAQRHGSYRGARLFAQEPSARFCGGDRRPDPRESLANLLGPLAQSIARRAPVH